MLRKGKLIRAANSKDCLGWCDWVWSGDELDGKPRLWQSALKLTHFEAYDGSLDVFLSRKLCHSADKLMLVMGKNIQDISPRKKCG